MTPIAPDNAKQDDARVHAWFVAAIVATASITINAVVPASPLIGDNLQFDSAALSQIAGFFVLGYAIGHGLIGAAGDRLPMRCLLAWCLVAFAGASLLAATASDAQTFLTARFAQGLSASACPIIGRVIVRRTGSFEASAKKLASASALFTWAPVLAPLLAGLAVMQLGWRALFVALAAYGLAAAWMVHRSSPDLFAWPKARTPILSDLRELTASASFRRGLSVASLMFGGFFSYLALAPALAETAGAPPLALSVTLVASAYAIGGATSRWLLSSHPSTWVMQAAVRGSAVIGPAVVLVAITSAPSVFTLALSCSFAGAAGAALPNATALAMRDVPHNATMAMALLGGTKMALAAAISFAVTQPSMAPTATLGAILVSCSLVAMGLVGRSR